MSILTPPGAEPWKNVEMTGYVKVVSTASSSSSTSIFGSNINSNNNEESASSSDIDWRARGGRHNSNVPYEGTALNGRIYTNGTVAWKKEIWHTGGYTNARSLEKATNSILDRWNGWKVAMYNINNNQAVKMESYLDDNNDNNWRKVSDVVDNGGWYAKSSDKVFYSADCGRPKDYIITNGEPIATFRAAMLQ
jgi:enamine deaminase RidA (YjgF/YER057c/UK114 family)